MGHYSWFKLHGNVLSYQGEGQSGREESEEDADRKIQKEEMIQQDDRSAAGVDDITRIVL